MVDKPKILHIFDGFRVGGTEVRTCHIINALKNNYHHLVVAVNGDFSARQLIDDDVSIDYIHPGQCSSGLRVRQFFQIAKFLNDASPQLMVAYEWGAIDWVMTNTVVKKCPTIMTIEGFEEAEIVGQKKMRWLLRRLFYPRCAKVVSCSKVLTSLAKRSWGLESSGQVVHIPNGINCDKFSPPTKRGSRGKTEPVMLACVASLIKLKNHALLLRAVAALQQEYPVELFLVGDGPERGNLEHLTQELGLEEKVRFAGLLANPAKILQRCDIFCLTSDTEQMPMVVLEAMACGLPIVSTDVGDVAEMVSLENRPFVVRKGDHDLLVKALRGLCGDTSGRRAIGQANLLRCRDRYDEKIMFNRYQELYQQVIVDARVP